MTYQQTLDFLYAQLPVFEKEGAHAYKPGLERIEVMDGMLGHPHRRYKTIHVAGTNGKGSVSHTLAAILQAQGLRVGLFTSPHLLDFSERIRINGDCIEHQYVTDWVGQHYEGIRHLHPSFFELATMMAFCYFADRKVDIAIIEVGLGGRLDCSNIITPVLSVITNVSFDHTQYLGNTLHEIAAEKAGIMKTGVPCVIGECQEDAVRKVYEMKAEKVKCPLIVASDHPRIVWVKHFDNHVEYESIQDGTLCSPLTGTCQARNANTIVTAVEVLRASQTSFREIAGARYVRCLREKETLDIGEEALKKGMADVLEMTHLAGRWQTLAHDPMVIADTGHNEACFAYIGRQLRTLIEQGKTLHVVFGMMRDKDVCAVLKHLPCKATYYFCSPQTPRAIPAAELAELAGTRQLCGETYSSVEQAYYEARKKATDNDIIFAGGSNFVVAEVMQMIAARQ